MGSEGNNPDSWRKGRYKSPTMTVVYSVLWLAGLLPLFSAWWKNRRASLQLTFVWAAFAWFTWGWAFLATDTEPSAVSSTRYIALGMTGAAGIAVLGARRPQVLAWNLVLVGLLPALLF